MNGVEAIVSIDERGQMVLPKGVREKAGIRAGDKFAVITWEKDREICCILLIKTDKLAELIKGLLSPIMSLGVKNEE